MPTFDFDGSNAFRSNVTPHSASPDQSGRWPFSEFMDLIVDGANRIRKRRGKGTAIGSVAGAVVAAHEFERVDPVTGVSTYYQIVATASTIYIFSGGIFVAQSLPITPTGAFWQFLNFSNRCFAVNGKDAAIVFDGTAWHLVGFDAPTAVLTYSLGGLTTFGVISATQGSPTITVQGAPITTITSVGTTATAQTPTAHNLQQGSVVTISGAAVGAYNGTYTVVTVPDATHFTYTFAGGASPCGGVPIGFENLHTGTIWLPFVVDINGIRYTGSTFDAANTLTITEGFKEASASGLGMAIYHGAMSWTNPPRYAYAYFNADTGHVTDISPILQISEKNQNYVTVTVVIPAAQQNADAYAAGFKKIKMFRPVKDGTFLVAINVDINNVNNNATAITYTETNNTGIDTALTNLAAPQDQNKKAPTAMVALAQWQGRIWGLRPSDPTNSPPDAPRAYFTPLPTSEVQFGVAAECWPRRFAREGLGRPLDMIALGSESIARNLLVVAADGNYTVDGYDQSTFTQFFRLPHSLSGGFRGGALDMDGALVQMFRDKHLFLDGEDVGLFVQDRLDAINANAITVARVHAHAYESFRYLYVSVPKDGATQNSYTLILDRDRQRFIEWSFGFTAAHTMHAATGELELWAGDASGNVFKLMVAGVFQDSGVSYQPYFRTNPIRSAGRRIFRRVHVFVGPAASNPAALIWTLNYRRDGEVVGTTVNLQVATVGRESAAGLELVYEFEQPVICNTFDCKVTMPLTNLDLYVEKMQIDYDDEQEDLHGP